MILYYILDGREPRPVADAVTWAEWFEASFEQCRVADDRDEHTRVRISTVFLGLDSNAVVGRPILFETMVFVPADAAPALRKFDRYQRRYTTWGEAEAGHRQTADMITAILAEA
jgi:hypothetical protein